MFLHEFPLLIDKDATLRNYRARCLSVISHKIRWKGKCSTFFTALSIGLAPIPLSKKLYQLNHMGNFESNTFHRRKVKKKATRETGGHVLIGTFLKLPIFCEYCCEFMWGTMAYRCKACDVLLHKVSI